MRSVLFIGAKLIAYENNSFISMKNKTFSVKLLNNSQL